MSYELREGTLFIAHSGHSSLRWHALRGAPKSKYPVRGSSIARLISWNPSGFSASASGTQAEKGVSPPIPSGFLIRGISEIRGSPVALPLCAFPASAV